MLSAQVCCRDQQCHLIRFKEVPTNTLNGGRFRSDEVIDYKTMEYPFLILEVKGTITYKHLSGGGSKSVMKLQRAGVSDRPKDIVQLVELVGACDDVKTQQIAFDYCNNKSFSASGEKGDMLLVHG